MVRGDIPIEPGYSWFTTKAIIVALFFLMFRKYREVHKWGRSRNSPKNNKKIGPLIGDKIYQHKRNTSILIPRFRNIITK